MHGFSSAGGNSTELNLSNVLRFANYNSYILGQKEEVLMVKLVAMFKKPADTSSFDDHYEKIHIPLVRKMPGLRRLETSKVTGAPMSVPAFYRMAEMYFDDQQSLQESIMSPDGMAAAKDLLSFAKEVVQMFFADVAE